VLARRQLDTVRRWSTVDVIAARDEHGHRVIAGVDRAAFALFEHRPGRALGALLGA
jgi:hypothetical protein